MINLDPVSITTASATMNGVVTNTVTDTLRVSYVEISFEAGSVMAMVQRGTMVATPAVDATDTTPAIPAGSEFVENMPQLRIQLNADGSFSSTNGVWAGSVPPQVAAGFVGQLKAGFDAFILGAGKVDGKAV